jgi:hypothetical protein
MHVVPTALARVRSSASIHGFEWFVHAAAVYRSIVLHAWSCETLCSRIPLSFAQSRPGEESFRGKRYMHELSIGRHVQLQNHTVSVFICSL